MAQRAAALAVLALLSFQSSRILLANKLENFYDCPHTKVWATAATVDQSSVHDDEQFVKTAPVSRPHDPIDHILGCHGNLGGMVFAQSQPLVEPGLTFFSVQPTLVSSVIQPVLALSDVDLPSPFQPPRA